MRRGSAAVGRGRARPRPAGSRPGSRPPLAGVARVALAFGSLVLTVVLLVMPPASVSAQPAGPSHRVGFLGNSTAALEANLVGPFREGLRQFGYVEGQNLLVEYRWAGGRYERFPALIAELLAQRVDLIVTAGTPATLAVKQATTTVPIVMIAVGDPVGTGIVPSLGRPGGNITGLTSISTEIDGKRLELLREVVPGVSHVAVLWNSASPLQVLAEQQTQAAARQLGLRVLSLGVRTEAEIEAALGVIVRERSGALLVLADRLFLHHRNRLMDFALQQRLPGVHAYGELVEAGGLMSFGPSYEEMHRRAAYFVDRILRGAWPGDLPVERPAHFELVINLRAARLLGLKIPRTVLLRATRLIE
jgi:putative ABC transport system substrate-binding protein